MTTLADLQKRNLAGMGRDAEAPSPIDNTTILQSDKPTNKQADPPTHQQTTPPTDKQANKPADKPTVRQAKKQAVTTAPVAVESSILEEQPAPRRVDGRTMRVRQETADRTMVTSLRLAVPTIEALDEFCWHNRRRKQDVVQAALDMYFAAMAEDETREP